MNKGLTVLLVGKCYFDVKIRKGQKQLIGQIWDTAYKFWVRNIIRTLIFPRHFSYFDLLLCLSG